MANEKVLIGVKLDYEDELNGLINKLKGKGIRLDFTTESEQEMRQILVAYTEYLKTGKADFSFLKDYTTGHYKKGAL